MRIFITGGTGFIGGRLAENLVNQEHDIIILSRDPVRAVVPVKDKVTFVKGDLFDKGALRKGKSGCDWVFHMAAFTKTAWSKDPLMPFRTNVTGTINVIEASIECNIKKVVITSTGGTMGYSKDGNPVDESTNPDPEYHTLYEKTKANAEKIALSYTGKGTDIIIVNPTRVYGPGRLSKSNSLTKIVKLYISGLWRIIPGNGESIGNYVFIDDVPEGHVLAARLGRNGGRYILGGENLSFGQLFQIIGNVTGKRRKVFSLSFITLKRIIKLTALFSKITGIPPLITQDWLDKYMNDWIMLSDKAVKELGYKITPFCDGIAETIKWFRRTSNGNRLQLLRACKRCKFGYRKGNCQGLERIPSFPMLVSCLLLWQEPGEQ